MKFPHSLVIAIVKHQRRCSLNFLKSSCQYKEGYFCCQPASQASQGKAEFDKTLQKGEEEPSEVFLRSNKDSIFVICDS